jgi:hypothetical protein
LVDAAPELVFRAGFSSAVLHISPFCALTL